MVTTHNLGFPRIGAQRELKFALEAYWRGESRRDDLIALDSSLRRRHWQQQAELDRVPVGDFSFYDQVLDMSFTLGNLPERARGRSAPGGGDRDACHEIQAGEMTKWFDSNYHYIVPEFTARTKFSLDASRLLDQLHQAIELRVRFKPVIIGPVTYLWLGKAKDGTDRLALLDAYCRSTRSYWMLWRPLGLNGFKSTSRSSSPNSIAAGKTR